jgi:hypothetical protein
VDGSGAVGYHLCPPASAGGCVENKKHRAQAWWLAAALDVDSARGLAPSGFLDAVIKKHRAQAWWRPW